MIDPAKFEFKDRPGYYVVDFLKQIEGAWIVHRCDVVPIRWVGYDKEKNAFYSFWPKHGQNTLLRQCGSVDLTDCIISLINIRFNQFPFNTFEGAETSLREALEASDSSAFNARPRETHDHPASQPVIIPPSQPVIDQTEKGKTLHRNSKPRTSSIHTYATRKSKGTSVGPRDADWDADDSDSNSLPPEYTDLHPPSHLLMQQGFGNQPVHSQNEQQNSFSLPITQETVNHSETNYLPNYSVLPSVDPNQHSINYDVNSYSNKNLQLTSHPLQPPIHPRSGFNNCDVTYNSDFHQNISLQSAKEYTGVPGIKSVEKSVSNSGCFQQASLQHSSDTRESVQSNLEDKLRPLVEQIVRQIVQQIARNHSQDMKEVRDELKKVNAALELITSKFAQLSNLSCVNLETHVAGNASSVFDTRYPVTSIDELRNLEEELKVSNKMESLVNELIGLGGINPADVTKRCIDHLMSYSVQANVNWLGSSRADRSQKHGLQNSTLTKAIFRAVDCKFAKDADNRKKEDILRDYVKGGSARYQRYLKKLQKSIDSQDSGSSSHASSPASETQAD